MAALLAMGAVACGESPLGSSDASTDRGVIGGRMDAGPDGGVSRDGGSLSTTIRIAHLSPDTTPIDLCYRGLAAQTFTGPILSSEAIDGGTPADAGEPDGGASDATLDGGPAIDAGPLESGTDASPEDAAADTAPSLDGGVPSVGLAYLHVSGYVTIPGADTFDLAVVPAGQGSCDGPLLVTKITLDAGKHATLLLLGLSQEEAGSAQALALTAFTDDPRVPMGSTRTRLIHAAVGAAGLASPGPLSAGVASGVAWVPFAAVIDPGAAAQASDVPPIVDGLGYHTEGPIAPPSSIKVRSAADAGGLAWVSALVDLSLATPAVHTGFIVSDPVGQLALLWCLDTNAGSGFAACTFLRAAGLTPR